MNRPSFSICIPNYNYGRFIGQTIQSVLNQSYQKFEIIVVDNASTDNSVEVVRAIKDQRIRLICNNYNIGFARNLQRATEQARNDFVILLSSDDLMRPFALAAYAEVIRAQRERALHTVIWSATEIIDENDRVTHLIHMTSTKLMPVETPVGRFDGNFRPQDYAVFRGVDVLKASLLAGRSPATFCSTAYPRCMWEAIEGYDTTYRSFPDATFLRKLLALNPDVVYIPQELFAYRVHNSNQVAKALAESALSRQVDGYMQVIDYDKKVLPKVGLSQRDLARVYIDQICLREAISELSSGNYARAFKIWAFAFGTYPGAAFGNIKSYVLMSLLAMGPAGTWIARLVRDIRRGLGLQGQRPE